MKLLKKSKGRSKQSAPAKVEVPAPPIVEDDAASSELSFMSGGDNAHTGESPELRDVVPPLHHAGVNQQGRRANGDGAKRSLAAAPSSRIQRLDTAQLLSEAPGIARIKNVADDSFAPEEMFAPTRHGAGRAHEQGEAMYQMADYEEWNGQLDHDVEAVAAMLAEQMRSNPEEATDVSAVQQDLVSDLVDPLGMGNLNLDTMRLEETSSKVDQTRQRHNRMRHAALRAAATTRLGGRTDSPSAKTALMPDAQSQLLITSPTFEPWFYLATVHGDKSQAELRDGQAALESTLEKGKDEMRLLVKEHFQRFIGSKGTIDDIALKLRDVGQRTTKDVLATALKTEAVANSAFSDILARYEATNAVEQKLLLLNRFEAVLRMPARLAELAANHDLPGVVSEYRKSKKMLPVKEHALWAELSKRVEREVTKLFMELMASVHNPSAQLPDLISAIQHLEILKGEGLLAAQGLEPLDAFVAGQQTFLTRRLRFIVEQHIAAANVAMGELAADAAHDVRRGAPALVSVARARTHAERHAAATDALENCSTVQLAWLDLLRDLTNLLCHEMSTLVRVTESTQLSQLYADRNKQDSWQKAERAMRQVLNETEQHVRTEMTHTLQTLWEHPDPDLSAHIALLNILGSAHTALEQAEYAHGTDTLRSVAEEVLGHGIGELERVLAAGVDDDEWEDWRTDPFLVTNRHPVSPALRALFTVVSSTMQQFAGLNNLARSSCGVALNDVHARMSAAFLKRLSDTVAQISRLLDELRADAAQPSADPSATQRLFATMEPSNLAASLGFKLSLDAEEMTLPVKALALIGNTHYLREQGIFALMLPRLQLVCGDDVQLRRDCANQVDQVLGEVKRLHKSSCQLYVRLQGGLLQSTVQHYMISDGTLWDSMPLCKSLRNSTYEMAFALVLITDQVVTHAGHCVQEMMQALVDILVTNLLTELKRNIARVSAAALANLFLEINFVEGIVPNALKSNSFDTQVEKCYDRLLETLLERQSNIAPNSALGRVLSSFEPSNNKQDDLESLHGCLQAHATKILPPQVRRATLHFDCFKAISAEKEQESKAQRRHGAGAGQETKLYSLEHLHALARVPEPTKQSSSRSTGQRTKGPNKEVAGLVKDIVGKLDALILSGDAGDGDL